MKKKLLIALVLAAPLQANAVLITSSVGDYDVTTVTGRFDVLSDTLMSQVWSGDHDLALEFAGLVEDSLEGQSTSLGPFFAYDASPSLLTSIVDVGFWSSVGTREGTVPGNGMYTFAVAKSVPEPATLTLLGLGLLGLGLAKRRRAT